MAISGTVSLPGGQVAPAGGMELSILVSEPNGLDNPAGTRFVGLPEGEGSAAYSMTIPDEPGASWVVRYHQNYGPEDYLTEGYYSNAGTQVILARATLLNGGLPHVGIDMTLITTQDTDADGISDAWEIKYFGNITTANGTTDYDRDGYSDLQEYLNGDKGETDPQGGEYDPKTANAPGGTGYVDYDTDDDGLFDSWEMTHFGNLTTADGTTDYDRDGYSDLQEYLNGDKGETDPKGGQYDPKTANEPGGTGFVDYDTDDDGLFDSWEMTHFGNLTTADGTTDYDRDGYSDLQEYLNGLGGETDPHGGEYDPKTANAPGGTGYVDYDTDDDGLFDSWEMTHFGDLTTADGTTDYDRDGYSDLQEYLNGLGGETDPQGGEYDPKTANAPGGTGFVDYDTDDDGLFDSWEMTHFGDLTTADGTTDHDRDGYSDLQEYLSGDKGETDPKGSQYDPKTANEPGGTGYVNYDTDDDGLFDSWEMTHFGNLTTADGTTDYDRDGYSDLQEYLSGDKGETDPKGSQYDPKTANEPGGTGYVDYDTDDDGLFDSWEMTHFGDLTTADGTTDHDRDGYSDLQEYLSGDKGETDPKGSQYDPKTANEPGGTGYVNYDTDDDGLFDSWEMTHFGNLTTADGTTDYDRDGYSDLQEYLSGDKGETDPKGSQYDPKTANEPGGTGFVDYDTDDDGLFDSWEMTHFGNLTTADGTTDYDRDGYSDLQEYLNERNGVRDPLGVQHDPKTANAPEGQGYTNSDDDFWQLMIPVIINGALESAANQGR